MRANNVLGIIYSNAYDEALNELTSLRTMGSVPFGARYRLIDFPLSNMVNCGMTKVGIITKSNYRSLMDHIGNGKPWDLSRKREGIYMLPPFNNPNNNMQHGKINTLAGTMDFISRSSEEYVLLTDSNVVGNIDFSAVFDFHSETDADITAVYAQGRPPRLDYTMGFTLDENSRITKASLNPAFDKKTNYCLNMFVMRKSLLERLVNNAFNSGKENFEKSIILPNLSKLNVMGYEAEGFIRPIDSLKTYWQANMDLLNTDNCNDLFCEDRPVFTKSKDEMPTIFGLGSHVKNSLIADGCIIEGEVQNCIIFRGVRVGRNAVVKNSIIMQDTYISDGCKIDSVITDKSVVIKPNKSLISTKYYPVYVGKNIVI